MTEPRGDYHISVEDLIHAERLAALRFTENERELMIEGINETYEKYLKMREIPINNNIVPALGFDPRISPPFYFSPEYNLHATSVKIEVPDQATDLAFLPITHLAHLLMTEKLTSVELTELYLSRLEEYDKELRCVITLTKDLALEQAEIADKEIREDKYRGLLHGIPYGIKDLFAHPAYPTTWGAEPFKNQIINTKATVIEKLEQAGAIMTSKLSVGALAWGDVWFGGKTKSPYNPDEGSSGSSAGSASAVAAGLVAFAIGTETWGSIVSPATACGVTGLRPTFGRVSRAGVMSLSWTMDKVGPICRTVEDCAIVFDTIHGSDDRDRYTISRPFRWTHKYDYHKIKVGYDKTAFEEQEDATQKEHDLQTLDTLKNMGVKLKEIKKPALPITDISFILMAEAATIFDDLTLSNDDDKLVRQSKDSWPNVFRQARLIPAVEYIKANRIRYLLMEEMEKIFSEIDVYIAPSFSEHLLLTNLTGHPCVVVPNGFRENNMPTSITFIGNLFKENYLLQLSKSYQDKTEFHLKRPVIGR